MDPPADEFNFPFTRNYPHLLGANSAFRRTALIEVGGFDEEFDYYLDETDVICRVIDDGWKISQLSRAIVHHKFLKSTIRDHKRILKSWFSVFKNKLYFSLMQAGAHHSTNDALNDYHHFVSRFRTDADWALGAGLLSAADRERLESHQSEAFDVGLRRGLSGQRRLLDPRLSEPRSAFLQYPTVAAPTRGTFVLLSQEYPPGAVGGVGRYIHQLAVTLAKLGHQIHVITTATQNPSVDLEDGVWVHRLWMEPAEGSPFTTAAGPVPPHIWNASVTRQKYIGSLTARKRVDAVYAPLWDAEAAALLLNGDLPVVLGLQTTLAIWLESHAERKADQSFMTQFVHPMMALERECLARAAAIHGISQAIMGDVARQHDMDFGSRAVLVPLGLDDDAAGQQTSPERGDQTELRLLFVGRLEGRKGIDVLLEAVPQLLEQFPSLQVDIVGNDTLAGPDGRTYRASFEDKPLALEMRRRVRFHGEVDGPTLRALYKACDLFVAPSRYESFGLVFVEAMMFGKPSIGTAVGGIPEVVSNGHTGILVEPGNGVALAAAINELLADGSLRSRMGIAARRRYEESFTPEQMARSLANVMLGVSPTKQQP